MSNALIHRGPDDDGGCVQDQVGMWHRRLSIIDLPGGRQPFFNEDRQVCAVFNGEIYNYESLRRDLIEKGHVFKSRCDGEVIVHLFEEEGERCVQSIDGMFAFALWSSRKKELLLARDRLGQKPLFYRQNGEDFWFASEIKALLEVMESRPNVNLEALHHYLSLRFIPAPMTMFEGIQNLPAGHYLVLKDGHARLIQYWDVNFTEKDKWREEELLDCLRERLAGSVQSHLRSDVPVGAYLSGGMDTSMLVAMMGQLMPRPFKTFTVGVGESDCDEGPFARRVALHCRTEHFQKVVCPDLIRSLPQMIWCLDQPSDPIAACMFEASRLAASHVKVVIGGDGGDELFGGFDRYLGINLLNSCSLFPAVFRSRLLTPLIQALPDSHGYKNLVQQIRWIHQVSAFKGADRYAETTFFFRFTHAQKRELFGDRLWGQLKDVNSTDVLRAEFCKGNAEDLLDRMLYTDLKTRLPEHTLLLTDRMSMAHSLEARSPFLDHTLVEMLAKVPAHFKIRGRKLKYALRKLARDFLPSDIVGRRKQGFMFPLAYWFKGPLYGPFRSTFERSRLIQEGWFRKDAVFRLLDEHRENRADHHVRLWMLLNLELWFQIFIEGKDPHASFL